MFQAQSISLCQGISYDNVWIAEQPDYITYNIPQVFATHPVVFWHQDKMCISHASNVRVIKLDSIKRKFPQPENIAFSRIVMNGDIVYESGSILHQKYYIDNGIPLLFQDEHKIFEQLVFNCSDGTFITHDINICTVILNDSKRKIKSQL